MKQHINYGLFIVAAFLVSSCKKFVEVAPPRTSLSNELVFSDDKTAESAVLGLYSSMNGFTSSFANTQASFYPAMGADEMHSTSSSADADEFKENALTEGNRIVSGLWSEPYSLIYHTNAVIEGLTSTTAVTPATSKRLMGEAKFLRAFYYFYLVNYFGDVPLIQNTNFLVNTNLPRTAANLVYDAIVQDLLDAQEGLSDAYLSAERIRANKAAATALLARVYLYRGQWDKAAAEATKVLTDNRYVLSADLNSVFLKTSQEAIWQLQAINTSTTGPINTWEAYSLIPVNSTNRPSYIMYPDFVANFEALTDKRYTEWLRVYTPASGPQEFYPYKYKVRVGPVTEYSMVLRKAEQFLVRAEARAQSNDLPGATSDLDSVRLRAGLAALPTNLTKEELLLAVEKERKLELFSEWGHRWLDLKRTGRALTVLGSIKTGVVENDLTYPIPLDAILTNTKLEQNDGY